MKLNSLIFSALLTTLVNASDMNTTTQPLSTKQEGIKYIKMLGGALKGELQAQMKADKTGLAALGFCTAQANEITNNVNKKLPAYAKVRRTALKVRNNTHNTPDALDTKIMQEYIASIEAKTFTPKDIKVVVEGNVTRIYKPLISKPVCLKCHGSNISKDIREAITAAYPQDKAVDFKEGSLRGVIVAEIKKH
jgi:hypothetical protein